MNPTLENEVTPDFTGEHLSSVQHIGSTLEGVVQKLERLDRPDLPAAVKNWLVVERALLQGALALLETRRAER
jgi:hypothetical protein